MAWGEAGIQTGRPRNVRSAQRLGRMERLAMDLLTAAQMRAVEQVAIAAGEVTGLELMERAGRGVVEAVFAQWPELARAKGADRGPAPVPPRYLGQDEDARRAVVLCGPGNNGGDGFVVARLLKDAGWGVEVFLFGEVETLPPDAKVNAERWRGMGRIGALADFDAWEGGYDLGVDAVFGTGLSRPVSRDVAARIEALNALPRVVGVDFPSGICSDSGRFLSSDGDAGSDRVARCHLSVTFQFEKIGHVLASAPERCGSVVVCDIGLDPKASIEHLKGKYEPGTRQNPDRTVIVRMVDGMHDHADFVNGRSPLSKTMDEHKFDHGSALILSGGVGRGGAARLAARGCLRIGAGLVTLCPPPAALIENAARLDAIMLRAVKDGGALAGMLAEDDRISAVCLGPGLGTGEREAGLVRAVLRGDGGVEPHPTQVSVVLDGDALTILSKDADLMGVLHPRCVLTPHAGEFARLFPDIAERLDAHATAGPAYSKVDATREAARRAGCVVLFKGPDTVIADPAGRCSVNSAHYERAAPWLATAGSGDVLAGFVTGLLARGVAPMQAAQTAAWLHVECALRFGAGLIAEDLPEQLPEVFRELRV